MKIQVIIAAIILLALTSCQKKEALWRTIVYNSAMEHSLVSAKTTSDNWLRRLKMEVKNQGNSREGLERIKRAERLKKETAELLGEIEKVKWKMVTERGDGLDPKAHTVKKPLASSGLRKEVESLIKKLASYMNFLKAEFKDLDIEPLDKTNEGYIQDKKQFYDIYFKGTNVVEGLTSLTHFQSKVLQYEQKVAKKLGPIGNY